MLGYIDPNTVQNIFGGLGPLLAGFLAVAAGVLFWPLRFLYRKLKAIYDGGSRARKAVMLVSGAALFMAAGAGLALLFIGKGDAATMRTSFGKVPPGAPFSRVIVLGMDGLDPNIVEAMMQKGELPNFSKLAASGSYSRLATSTPPESPVAWSSIATGCQPGEHGLFDFIHRDPKTYVPVSSLRKAIQGILGPRYEKVRKQVGFWKFVTDAGAPATVIRWPVSFPAEKVNGNFLSGLGVPDLMGWDGRYTFYTSAPAKDDPSPFNVVEVKWDGQSAQTSIQGPLKSRDTYLTLELTIRRAGADAVTLEIKGAEPLTVRKGEWSAWATLRFKVGFSELTGDIKFLLTECGANLKLSASPIQVDPSKQAYPLTCPDCFGKELQDQMGIFHTLGMPEQVHPLSHERYDYDAFLSECGMIQSERRKMLDLELSRFDSGLLAFVFDSSDRIQHMFWSMRDPKHPLYDPALAAKYADVIPGMYREMDGVLGSVLAKCDAKTALIVLSDHGFNSFRRAVHVNRWLIQNGYLTLKDGNDQVGQDIFRNVDWTRTKAYALGFASVYLNVKGREGQGIVDPSATDALSKEIAAKLREWKDPDNGETPSIVKQVYIATEIYSGKAAAGGPDLVIGLQPGYRASWQTALGGAPLGLVEDNKKRWSGDHLIDPSCVPGILFTNQRIAIPTPGLTNIAPTVLKSLGVKIPEQMKEAPLF